MQNNAEGLQVLDREAALHNNRQDIHRQAASSFTYLGPGVRPLATGSRRAAEVGNSLHSWLNSGSCQHLCMEMTETRACLSLCQ